MSVAELLAFTVGAALPVRHAQLQARRFLVAVALTESDGCHVLQHVASGPTDRYARSLWQIERPTLDLLIRRGWLARVQAPVPDHAWERLYCDQLFAARVARALLLSHPHPLPLTPLDALDQYLALWRPGRPRPDRFREAWAVATEVVR